MLRDDSDILGESEAPRRSAVKRVDSFDPRDGAPITYLQSLFGLSRYKVQLALRDLRPIGRGAYDVPLYDFAEAAARLVKPKIDLTDYLQTIKAENLPEKLRETYWNARTKEVKHRALIGDLWHTETVLEKMTEVLKDLRTMLTLIPDDVDRAIGLTPEQMKLVTAVVRKVQDAMHAHLVAFAKQGRTKSLLGEFDAAQPRPERDDDI